MTIEYELLAQARSGDADQRHRAALRVAHAVGSETLPLMFDMLGDRDWRVRKTIVDGLVREADERIVTGLIDSLYDSENAGKRNSATEALIRIGLPAVSPILSRLHSENDIDVRLSLVNLLGDLRTPEGHVALLALIATEDDINVVSSAVSSVGKYRESSAISPLVRLLQRDDLWLKFHVIEALGEIGDRSALPAILPLYSEKSLKKPVLEAIGRISDVGTVNFLLRIIAEEEKLNLTALRALVQVAEAPKPRIVEAAQRTLIQRRFRESFPSGKIPALIDHLFATPKRDVKNFILKFLGWSGDQRVLPALLSFVENPDSAEVAAQSIIDFGAEASLPVLERLRNAEDDDVTALLMRVVNVIGGRDAISTIITFLDHENPTIRRLAIETLGQIVEPSTLDYLLAKLDDPDVGCQQAAVNSISSMVAAFPEVKKGTLGKIRRLLAANSIPVKLNSLSIFVNIQGEGFADELLFASKDGDPVIRQKAVSLMGKFGEEVFADQLVLSLADESTTVRVAAIQSLVKLRPQNAMRPLISSLEDADVWIRTAAAQALGEYRDPSTIQPLLRHLNSDQVPVKIAVIEALGKTESPEVRATIFRIAEDPDVEIRRAALLALSRIPGDDVFERLAESLRSSDWRLRAAGATALGQRGDVRALEALHQLLLGDSDPYVQQSVVFSLDRIGDRTSFPYLLEALNVAQILDEVSELFIRHKSTYRDLLEEAWRTADTRREPVIAAILQAMRGNL